MLLSVTPHTRYYGRSVIVGLEATEFRRDLSDHASEYKRRKRVLALSEASCSCSSGPIPLERGARLSPRARVTFCTCGEIGLVAMKGVPQVQVRQLVSTIKAKTSLRFRAGSG